ncbi:MAG: response regulator [Chloroflexota bacterium]|nr:response regulator [Chloroflexota bacterium]
MVERHEPTHLQTRHLQPVASGNTAPLNLGNTGPLDVELPWVIEMRVVGTPTTLQAKVQEQMLIGRSDSEQGIFPEIDLLPYNAFAGGVSRRHAIIEMHDGRLFLKDLKSTNGTRLNNVPLTPNELYRLRHGDQVSFGQVRVQVLFSVVPAHDSTMRFKVTGKLMTQTQELARLQHNKHILVVEDDPSVGEVFRLALQRAGYQVTHVNSVVNALSIVIQGMPDGIVLDLMLPDFNGLDFLRYVRKNNPHSAVPILVVSAASGGYQISQAQDAGADMFLPKPVSVEDLLTSVSNLLGLKPVIEA